MAKIIDLTGKTFGSWRVINLSHQVRSMLYWNCKCECGTERAVFGADLKRGASTNCGCVLMRKNIARLTTHGMSEHRGYRAWVQMKSRCLDKNSPNFYLYGERGIRVCDRWLESFENFWEDMGPTWQKGLSLEREEVNGNYNPGNCIWAGAKVQANNRRTNHIICTPEGPMTVQLAAEKYGLSAITIHSRIRYGWAGKDLLNPVEVRKRKKSAA